MDNTSSQQAILNKASEDKFLLVLNLPPILKSINTPKGRASNAINLDTLQFSVEGSIVPSIIVPDIDIPFAGQQAKVTSYSRESYPKNRIRFTVDNRFNNYWILWKWLDVLNDSKLSLYNQDNLPDTSSIRGLHNYQTNITIFALDEYNTKLVEFKYHKAFITGLGGIEYDYQKSGQIVSYFEYAYNQFYMDLL